jgi:putative transcriptional regulator
MSEITTTIRVKRLNDGTVVQVMEDGTTKHIESRTNWNKLNVLTEQEIESAALSDPDNLPLTDAEIKQLKPVPNLKAIRTTLHMTQEQFSQNFLLPLGTIRDWEQGAKQPDTAARVLLRVIEKDPEAVLQALEA